MRWSIRVATVFGIPIRMHWTFMVGAPVIVFFGALGFEQTFLWTAVFYAVVFSCVTLHELSHSRVAQFYGVTVRQIVLIPFGGIAFLDRIPEEARKEAAISIAGPAFNVVLAIALYAFMALVPHIVFIHPLAGFEAALENPTAFTRLVATAFWVNVALVIFNLLPAFPMDGGRLFRALLVALKVPYMKATSVSVLVSKVFLVLFVVLGFAGAYVLLLLAPLLYLGATGEERAVRSRGSLKQLRAGHLLPQKPVGIDPETPLGEVVALLLSSSQRHFPVIKRGRLLGVVNHGDLARTIKSDGGSDVSAATVMRPPVVVSPADSLADIQRQMESRGVAAACILRHGRLAGLVSQDVLQRLVQLLDEENPQ